LAIGLNVRVKWVLADGRTFPGLIVAGPQLITEFPGEQNWAVRLDQNPEAMRWINQRDLVEEGSFTATPLPVAPPPVVATETAPVIPQGTPVSLVTPLEPGADTRDAPQVAGLLELAKQLLLAFMRSPGRVTLAVWNLLPAWAKGALTQVGIVVGTEITVEAFGGEGFIPGIGLPDLEGTNGTAPIVPFTPGLPVGPIAPTEHAAPFLHNHIVGSWVANGVTFYRLFDGKLAVQNKKGRWKVWRPKKPIVFYATGAVDLKTMLRADAVLNRQAKKIAAMLNRRAPRKRAPKAAGADGNIVVVDGKAVKI